MSSEIQLLYPTLDLLIYDPGDGLGQGPYDVIQNRQYFWQRVFDRTLLTQNKLDELAKAEAVESSYIELLGPPGVEFFNQPSDGYYYPVKIGDTYALQIDSSGYKEWKGSPQPLSQLAEIKKIILERQQESPGKLGETWFMWGKLTNCSTSLEEVARTCYEHLNLTPYTHWNLNQKNQGTFEGATLFELWRSPSDLDEGRTDGHLILCFFPHYLPDQEVFDIAGRLYKHFLSLFSYRHKTLWLYRQSQSIKGDLKSLLHSLQKSIDHLPHQVGDLPVALQELQQSLANVLTIFAIYSRRMSDLEEYAHELETSIKRYRQELAYLGEFDRDSDLSFLDEFTTIALEKYLPRVSRDCQTLGIGLTLLENTLKTLEGIVSIEQSRLERAKINRDRQLQQLLIALGVGVGTATTSAAALSQKIITPIAPSNKTLHLWSNYGAILLGSLLLGLGASLAVSWYLKLKGRVRRDRTRGLTLP